jgi:hypothetical protein
MVHNKGIYRQHANLQDLFAFTKRTENNCMEWQLMRDEGYGKYRINQKKVVVSRVVCELVYGSPDAGQQALHSCDNPPCINPDHLRWGTANDNNQDKIERGRLKGERHPRAKFSDAQILELKQMIVAGYPSNEIITKFKISKESFYGIKSGKDWAHIKLSD